MPPNYIIALLATGAGVVIPAKQLKWIFIAVMLYMGLKMIGVFDWLGWPI